MKKRGWGGGERWGFFYAVIIFFIFLSIRLFVIGQVLPQSVASQKSDN